MALSDFERKIIKDTSIKLPNGGDTHIHPWGKKETDFTITTRLPGNVYIHDQGKDILPPKSGV